MAQAQYFFSWFVALRYLRSKRKEVFISIISIISILGVALSVTVLDVVLAVMTGFEAQLQAKLVDTSAHITINRYGRDFGDWQIIRDTTLKVPEVVSVAPYTYQQALLSRGDAAIGIMLRGVTEDPATRSKLGPMFKQADTEFEALFNPPKVSVDRPDGSKEEIVLPGIVVGRDLARRLGVIVGDVLTIMSPQFQSSPQGLSPRYRRFVVAGFYHSGLVEYEKTLAYTSLKSAQDFFSLGDRVSGLDVTVKDLFRAKEIVPSIKAALGDENLFSVSDWTQPNKALWDALRLEKRVYFIVLLLLILVASFSIISTLVMIVMEKSKDIAVFKAIGASSADILRTFFLQGIIIGVSGTVLGTLLGYLGCLGLREFGFKIDETVFSLSQVPVQMEPVNFTLVAISGFLITALAGIYPARRAARIRPAEALRYE